MSSKSLSLSLSLISLSLSLRQVANLHLSPGVNHLRR